MVTFRNVLEVIAAVHEVSVEKAAEIIYRNTLSLYFPWELLIVCWKENGIGMIVSNFVFVVYIVVYVILCRVRENGTPCYCFYELDHMNVIF